MLKLSQILMTRILLVGLAVGAIVGVAAGFGKLGMFYFDATQTDRTTGNSTDGPVSWHLSRWSRTPVAPRNELPEWVVNKPGTSTDGKPPSRPPGHCCPTTVPPQPTSCSGK